MKVHIPVCNIHIYISNSQHTELKGPLQGVQTVFYLPLNFCISYLPMVSPVIVNHPNWPAPVFRHCHLYEPRSPIYLLATLWSILHVSFHQRPRALCHCNYSLSLAMGNQCLQRTPFGGKEKNKSLFMGKTHFLWENSMLFKWYVLWSFLSIKHVSNSLSSFFLYFIY